MLSGLRCALALVVFQHESASDASADRRLAGIGAAAVRWHRARPQGGSRRFRVEHQRAMFVAPETRLGRVRAAMGWLALYAVERTGCISNLPEHRRA